MVFSDALRFVFLGQSPEIPALQKSLYRQLVGRPLDMTSLGDEGAVLVALREAAARQTVLLIVDDAWELSQLSGFECLDASTPSAMVVTTRIQKLVPNAPSFPLGVLEPDDAVALLLETAGALAVKPYAPKLYEAVEACGRLPLTLAVAGSMLEQFGGRCTDEFMTLLTEDRGEALREGEYGDMHVKVEDRIITATLENYSGGESEQIRTLFLAMAIFPEDVPVPVSLFTRLATSVFGASGKRACLQVRSWITALIRLSLVIGSLADGVFMHDIVRDYAMSRCKDLRAQQRHFLMAVVEAAPEGGWPAPWEAGVYGPDTPERYVAQHLNWHIRNAIDVAAEARDELLSRLVEHSIGLGFSAISSLGRPYIAKIVAAAEADGEWRTAGRLVHANAALYREGDGTLVNKIDLKQEGYELVRGIDLLAKASPTASVDHGEILACSRALTVGLTLSGAFADPKVVDRVKERSLALNERWRAVSGESFDYLRNALRTPLADAIADFFKEFNGDDFQYEEMTRMVDGCYENFGVIVAACLRLLHTARQPLERCYAASFLGLAMEFFFNCKARAPAWLSGSGFGSIEEVLAAAGGVSALKEAAYQYDTMAMTPYFDGDLCDYAFIGTFGPIFALRGDIEAIVRCSEILLSAFRKREAMQNEGLQVSILPYEGYNMGKYIVSFSVVSGLFSIAELLAPVHGRDTWEGTAAFFDEVWASHLETIWGETRGRAGTEAYQRATFLLMTFLITGDAPEGGVLEIISDVPEVVAQDRRTCLNLCWPSPGLNLSVACALAAERVGRDDLAERHASYVCGQYVEWNDMSRMAARLVLARVQTRRGRRAAAVSHFEHAAADAIEDGGVNPLIALRAGLECGGAEGAALVERAAAYMRRPVDETVDAYAHACGPRIAASWPPMAFEKLVGAVADVSDVVEVQPPPFELGRGKSAPAAVLAQAMSAKT